MKNEDHPNLYVRDTRRRYQPASAEDIVAAARAVVDQRLTRGAALHAPDAAQALFREKLAGCEREIFAVAYMDTRHRLIEYREMFLGSIGGAEVHPREVVKDALRLNAAALIVGHNHPSGVTEPSAADRAVTARLKQALGLIDVRLLDHIVVAGHRCQSMAAMGLV